MIRLFDLYALRRRISIVSLAAALLLAAPCALVSAQALNPEDAAQQTLNAARKAFNERRFDFAADKFREFIKTYPDNREVTSAQYGLGLSLMELPEKDFTAAAEALAKPAGSDSPDKPFANYYLGTALRGAGNKLIEQAKDKPPQEQQQAKAAAQPKFEDAAKKFALAVTTFTAAVKDPPAKGELPALLEWAARSRCDQCEMYIRCDKFKEAREAATPFLGDPILTRSQYRQLGLYQLGYACFGMKDYLEAGRMLSLLAPFGQEFGLHARYLLARAHHLSDERPEAWVDYTAVITEYPQRKKRATEALQKPETLKDKPLERAALQAFASGPTPDYVTRAQFYSAVLLSEMGKPADAADQLAQLIQQNQQSPLLTEMQLRQGLCCVQSGRFADGLKILEPLREHEKFGDQALWWHARATIGAADSTKPDQYQQSLNTAVDELKNASQRAAEPAKIDPAVKARCCEILMDLADTQQLLKQYKEAAATYQQALVESAGPERAQEALQRQITSLNLAGQYKESDALVAQFEKNYPKSSLSAAVLFRSAENSFMIASTGANATPPQPIADLTPLYNEAIKKYQRLIEKFPEFAYGNVARYEMATCQYRLGQFEKAIETISSIPDAERSGDLAIVNYLAGDCIIRTLPKESEDALQAGRLLERAEEAIKRLENFIGALPKSKQAPDAMLKLSHCYQQVGLLMADPVEKKRRLQQARETLDKFIKEFAQDPSKPIAVYEKARVAALMGESDRAAQELGPFKSDPLKNSTVAPLALIRLSELLRAIKKTDPSFLATIRAEQEAALLKDPTRAGWVPMLQYEHGMALKESGKPAEAAVIFEAMAKQFADKPLAVDAIWRAGQCREEDAAAALANARKQSSKSTDPAAQQTVKAAIDEHQAVLKQLVDQFQTHIDKLAKNAPGSIGQQHLMYEAAWLCRTLGNGQVEIERRRMQQEAFDKVKAGFAKQDPPATPSVELRPPEIPIASITIQPYEQRSIDFYKSLIKAAPNSTLANDARLELAEVLAQRNQFDPAIELLSDAIEKDVTPELSEKIRLRLASCFLMKNDPKPVARLVDPIVGSKTTGFGNEARYLAAEALIQKQDWNGAIKILVFFRDDATAKSASLADRALLRLGQAYAATNQWDQSRGAMEALIQRFANSSWVDEARYGIGLSHQNQKQFDPAVAAYDQVVKRTSSELAAKSLLQAGLCRIEQKRYEDAVKAFLTITYTYDYPDCSAPAWCEAARANLELKKPADAAKLYQRVLKDYPATKWAQVAQERLNEIK